MDSGVETFDFGPCCACGAENERVRNVIMLEQKTPAPGSGWGCFQCGLPAEGAFAVLCDECLDLGRPIRFAVAGEVKNKQRVAIEALGGEHKHDMTKHSEASDG
jgi:hypothetical protein